MRPIAVLEPPRLQTNNPFFLVFGVFLFSFFLILSFFSFILTAQAALPPAVVTYQGKLLVNNLAATTTQSVIFVLYDAATAGNALYTAGGTVGSPTAISVTPTNGLFAVDFGSTGTNELDPTIFQGTQSIYLEVRVGSETLTPRKQITASPFAYNAKYLDGVGATSTASSSTYIPVSDSSGNFSFNTVSTTATRDSLSWLQNQSNLAKLQLGYNNGGGYGGGATPGNLTMTSTDITVFNTQPINSASTYFQGAVFDGRYIYFVPANSGQGLVTRYDTVGRFTVTSSWSFYDLTNIDANAKGYAGAAFDGRYVYFSPYNNGANHGLLMRYDTAGSFTSNSSWTEYDLTNVHSSAIGFAAGVFDGRYLYLSPLGNSAAVALRYDTTLPLGSASSWNTFVLSAFNSVISSLLGATFDGRYVYFSTNDTDDGVVVRYDATAIFTATSSWSWFRSDLANSNSKGFRGAVFDGRYVYLAPYNNGSIHGQVTRYDTAAEFNATSSWSFYDTTAVHSNSKGFTGVVFDGRFVYFIPFSTAANTYSGQITRYDTVGPFVNANSWSVFDTRTVSSKSSGFQGGVFDGRYVYLAPQFSTGSNGQVTRLRAWAGGVDSTPTVGRIARGQELFIDAAGRIGLNTVGPNGLLTLANGALFIGNGTTTSSLENNLFMFASSTTNAQGLFLIDSSGNVSVSGTLDVFGLSTLRGGLLINNVSSTITNLTIINATSTNVTTTNFAVSSVPLGAVLFASSSSRVSGSTTLLYIDEGNQRIGIKTDTPDFTFHIVEPTANKRIGRIEGNSSGVSPMWGWDLGNQSVGLMVYMDGTGPQLSWDNVTIASLVARSVSQEMRIQTDTAIPLVIMTTNTERLRITGAGELAFASSTSNRQGLLLVDSSGNTSASGTFRTFGGVTSAGLGIISAVGANNTATTTITFYSTSTNPGNALVFDTDRIITTSTAALYSWRNGAMPLMSLSSGGALSVSSSIAAINAVLGTPGAPGDLAERVDIAPEEIVAPGDVMTLDPDKTDTYRRFNPAQDNVIAGVISTNPTIVVGNGKTDTTAVLAMLGRVPVKITLENGPINIGDPLTVSQVIGQAAKATTAGMVLGYALESITEITAQNQGRVLMFLRPTWWSPGLVLNNPAAAGVNTETDSDPSAISQIFTNLVKAFREWGVVIERGLIRVREIAAEKITGKELCAEDVCVTRDQLKQLLEKNQPVPAVSEAAIIISDQAPVASATSSDSAANPALLVAP